MIFHEFHSVTTVISAGSTNCSCKSMNTTALVLPVQIPVHRYESITQTPSCHMRCLLFQIEAVVTNRKRILASDIGRCTSCQLHSRLSCCSAELLNNITSSRNR